jgi:nitroimidazol reductase NimA-like FMN-containing flavoprotein (pyridoxamine 5'-phosphate oxidase superfamily)
MKYESVMGTGIIEVVIDAAQRRAGLDRIMAQYGNGKPPVYRPEALGKTLVLELRIEEMTAKRCV